LTKKVLGWGVYPKKQKICTFLTLHPENNLEYSKHPENNLEYSNHPENNLEYSNHPENHLEYSNYSRNVLEDVIDPTDDPNNVLEGFLRP